MVRTAESIGAAIRALAEREPAFAAVVERHGVPEPRNSEAGPTTLLRTIVGQQVSVAAARSMWSKLEAAYGSPPDLTRLLDASDEELRGAGISRRRPATFGALPSWCCPASSTLQRCPPTTRKRSRC